MRRQLAAAVAAIAGSVVFATAGPAIAAPQPASPAAPEAAPGMTTGQQSDELIVPTEAKRRAMRQEALSRVLSGEATAEKRGASTVVRMDKGTASLAGTGTGTTATNPPQYVELGREKTDKIFVVLAEFGDQRHPDYPDQDTSPATPGPTVFDGPQHNQIPEPNRAVDNKTVWQADYSADHYRNLYFGSAGETLKTFYERQSSGRYSVDGEVTDWVRLPYNEARYGRSNGYPCGGSICGNAWYMVSDALNTWVADRKAGGMTDEQLRAELAEFDVWDRSDHDHDGDFNEPDGYLDHFQIVHAGADQSDGTLQQGEDAIWAHRWYAFFNTSTGPGNNKLGGVQIGNTGLWVGDYTTQPENGGLGVFAHEYAHDLGLPDLYDTVGPGGGSENGVNWWSLMGQSRVSGVGEPVGLRANDLGAWEKLQLGWLDYETVVAGQDKRLDLGPGAYNTAKAQGAVVVLPDKTKTDNYGTPFAGSRMWWSTKGDNIDTTLTRSVDLTGKSTAALTLKAKYDIEDCDCDFLTVETSIDGGSTWTAMDGTSNGQPFIRSATNTPIITNTTNDQWVDVNVPLNAVAGKNIQLRLNYHTDGGVILDGFFADQISVVADGTALFTDGAESGNNGWTPNGFKTTTGTETQVFDNFYIASYRAYTSYDNYLKTGPYNFGDPTKPNWAQHFAYQDGLLVSYWDTSVADNNASAHPGEGQILPVDANPEPIYNLQGAAWRPRIAGYDAPFSLQKSDSFSLLAGGRSSLIRGKDAQPLFDDTRSYWYASQPTAGVKLPATGVKIRVQKQTDLNMTIRVFS